MKKTILSIAVFLAVATLQSFYVLPANAQTAAITYVGIKENGIEFELRLDHESNKNSLLIISDKNGDIVYEENFKEKKLVKRFLLPSDESSEYTFVVRNGALKYEKHFVISRSQVTTIHVNEVR